MKSFLFAILIAFLPVLPVLSDTNRAVQSPELTAFLESQAAELNDALTSSTEERPTRDDFFLRRISLRVRPRVSFGISSVLKLEIIPEADFYWQRPVPEGWVTFKP